MRRASGARNQQTARAGEHFVTAELNRRGAYAVTFTGNMPRVDILASNLDGTRTVRIQVKTRRSGTWHSSIREGRPSRAKPDEASFWVFVDLANDTDSPVYYLVPDWWMRNNIYRVHRKYLSKHGGRRKVNPKSEHHGIDAKRIAQWKDRWDLLKIF